MKRDYPEKYGGMVVINTDNYDKGFSAAVSVVSKSDIDVLERNYDCAGDGSKPWGFIANTDAAVNEDGFVGTPACKKYRIRTDEQKIYYYLGKDIVLSTSSGTKTIGEMGGRLISASSYGVNLKKVSNLYDLIKSCFINGECSDKNPENLAKSIGLSKDGTLSSQKVAELFGLTNVNQTELDTYYLSFEPVVRVPDSSPYDEKKETKKKASKTAPPKWNYTCKNSRCGLTGTYALSVGWPPAANQDGYKCAQDKPPDYGKKYTK